MNKKEIIIELIIAVLIAVLLSPLASSWPDGLERVAQDYGFIGKGEAGFVWDAPLPKYIFPGLKNEKLATSVAGLLGAVTMFGIAWLLAFLLKKHNTISKSKMISRRQPPLAPASGEQAPQATSPCIPLWRGTKGEG